MWWMWMWLHYVSLIPGLGSFHTHSHELAPSVLMWRSWLFAAALAMAFVPFGLLAQGIAPTILAPSAGQSLRGQVSITGTTDIPNFASAELDFAYASDSTNTWFLIQAFSQPVADSAIATWDTTSIGDGDYILRLRVTLQDGSFQDATVKVKVQNESTLPTIILTPAPTVTYAPSTFTPQASMPISTGIVGAVDSPTSTALPVFATPTALPSNPVAVQTNEIYAGIQQGALVIVGLFLFFGILIRLRRS